MPCCYTNSCTQAVWLLIVNGTHKHTCWYQSVYSSSQGFPSVNTGKEQRILSEDVTYVKHIILIYLEEKPYTAAFKLIGSHKNLSHLIKHQI